MRRALRYIVMNKNYAVLNFEYKTYFFLSLLKLVVSIIVTLFFLSYARGCIGITMSICPDFIHMMSSEPLSLLYFSVTKLGMVLHHHELD